MTYGEHAYEERLKAGMSGPMLAKLGGTTPSTIYLFEQGVHSLRLDTALRICGALDLSLNEYLGFEPAEVESREGWSCGRFAQYARQCKKLTKTALSKLAGISCPTIATIERGTRPPNLYSVMSLARALGMTPDEYLGNPAASLREVMP